MLQSFYVLTWDSLEQMVQGQSQGHSQGQGQETEDPELQFSSGSLQNVLATGTAPNKAVSSGIFHSYTFADIEGRKGNRLFHVHYDHRKNTLDATNFEDQNLT